MRDGPGQRGLRLRGRRLALQVIEPAQHTSARALAPPEGGLAPWRRGAQYVYGTECPSREQALKRYLQHNRNVYDAVPAGRLLVMDIAGGDGWQKLCRFIGRPVPTNITFPSRH